MKSRMKQITKVRHHHHHPVRHFFAHDIERLESFMDVDKTEETLISASIGNSKWLGTDTQDYFIRRVEEMVYRGYSLPITNLSNLQQADFLYALDKAPNRQIIRNKLNENNGFEVKFDFTQPRKQYVLLADNISKTNNESAIIGTSVVNSIAHIGFVSNEEAAVRSAVGANVLCFANGTKFASGMVLGNETSLIGRHVSDMGKIIEMLDSKECEEMCLPKIFCNESISTNHILCGLRHHFDAHIEIGPCEQFKQYNEYGVMLQFHNILFRTLNPVICTPEHHSFLMPLMHFDKFIHYLQITCTECFKLFWTPRYFL